MPTSIFWCVTFVHQTYIFSICLQRFGFRDVRISLCTIPLAQQLRWGLHFVNCRIASAIVIVIIIMVGTLKR